MFPMPHGLAAAHFYRGIAVRLDTRDLDSLGLK
jgi:hypothetical protein